MHSNVYEMLAKLHRNYLVLLFQRRVFINITLYICTTGMTP